MRFGEKGQGCGGGQNGRQQPPFNRKGGEEVYEKGCSGSLPKVIRLYLLYFSILHQMLPARQRHLTGSTW